MGVKVLSLFDGMSCGAIAFREMGIDVERYVAYEIDKYAVQVSAHNFPDIEQRGDVFVADFTEHEGFDAVIGGSPCTYWSIAQKNNRETEASGLGWELFSQYVRAIKEAKPRFFLYENNKSMSREIRASITETFGFEPILINSALVSAQNRNRLYWVGIRQSDGTYLKVQIEQPEDMGILLKDVLDCGCDLTGNEKSYCLTSTYNGAVAWNTIERSQRNMVAEPVNTTVDGKAQTVRASCYKDGIRNMVGNDIDRKTCVAEPVCVVRRGRYADTGKRAVKGSGPIEQFYEAREDGKTNAITTVQKDSPICEPVRIGCYPSPDGTIKNSQGMRLYGINGKSVNITAQGGGVGAKTGLYACPVATERLSEQYYHGNDNTQVFGKIECKNTSDNNGQPAQGTRVYNTNCKSICLDADSRKYIIDEYKPHFVDESGKEIQVYEVLNGLITIKDKQYPIKLTDGYYIIRKLTVSECMRLQTVPEWYDFSVISNSQAYKCLGNGWTVDVIAHILKSLQ